MYVLPTGDTPTAPTSSETLSEFINSPSVSTGAAMTLTYHGYKRTGSIFWALMYGVLGYWKPVVMVPIALAQGYGEKKPCP